MRKHPMRKILAPFPNGGKVLDIGSLNLLQYKKITASHPDVQRFGADYVDNQEAIPLGYTFKKADLNKERIPFEDGFFDLIVASHIIEHLNDPLNFHKVMRG